MYISINYLHMIYLLVINYSLKDNDTFMYHKNII